MFVQKAMLNALEKNWLSYVDKELLKKKVALAALEHIQSNMLVGLGTGSTAKYLIEGLGEKINRGELSKIRAIATSKQNQRLALSLGIDMVELSKEKLDIAIDGMDEIDPDLNAIKGLGGALTREKIVEARAKILILMADDSKLVEYLGQKTHLPVEVVQFGLAATKAELKEIGLEPNLRKSGSEIFVTDNGNYILDCQFDKTDIFLLAEQINAIPGVVEHGLFLNMANYVYIATDKDIRKMTK